ncbi:30S ribosomal protein S3 [Mycoplasma iguanae]|uniref:Small ribosomal subunit protein uS3 n=1 Tax=Mycoplasma iguanae TaxID=292461 RepID=A0ABY5R8G1_9MOLU|nr:30S ribosomal protein S3 [Mycoplasma iguanae]UVD81784.1 30S ribosomal protein S3 [Mycoplasma iguanae]
MGQKVNPNGFRFGITKKHQTTWFATKANFATFLLEDVKIREYLEKFVREHLIGKVEIQRDQKNRVTVSIHTAKPGAVLGQGGENVKKLTTNIQKFVKNKNLDLKIDIVNIEHPELNARLVAESIAIKLENRGAFRIAQKFAIRNALKAGAKGIKTQVSGRLNGVDMARTEGYTEGEMKLHTLRQNIDFAYATARTTYGALGIKVWISLGEVKEGGK